MYVDMLFWIHWKQGVIFYYLLLAGSKEFYSLLKAERKLFWFSCIRKEGRDQIVKGWDLPAGSYGSFFKQIIFLLLLTVAIMGKELL